MTTTTTTRSTISLHPFIQSAAGHVPVESICSPVVNSSAVSQLALRRALTSGRRRRKATKMVAVIVIMFAVSWLPIHVFHLWYRFQDDFPKTQATYVFKIVAHALSYANRCELEEVDIIGSGQGVAIEWLLSSIDISQLTLDTFSQQNSFHAGHHNI